MIADRVLHMVPCLHAGLNRTLARGAMESRTFTYIVAAMAALTMGACDDPSGPDSPLVITTESLPGATVGEPYSAGINASGGEGDYEWDIVSGELPPGFALNAEDLTEDDDALITGAAESSGDHTFTIEVESADGQRTTAQFTIAVNPQLIRNAALPPALVEGPYSVPLRATGGDGQNYSWEIVTGELPPGLTLEEDRIEGPATETDTTTVTLRVTSGGQTAVRTFEIRAVAHGPDSYDITPMYVSDVPPEIQPHLDAAIDLWESALQGDLGAVSLADLPTSGCGGFIQEADGTAADDILIMVNIDSIDGPGDVLGQAGPCLIRNSNTLPVLGILTLDSGDLLPLVDTETLTDIIAHEIGHVLGFGSIWDIFDLTENAGTDSTRYVGEQAVAEYHALGGSGPIPLEADGGQGTVDSHWDETALNTELMTGFIESIGTANPLSRISIASFADLGYEVDLDAADAFSLPASLRAHGSIASKLGHDRVLREPVRVIDDGPRSPATLPQR